MSGSGGAAVVSSDAGHRWCPSSGASRLLHVHAHSLVASELVAGLHVRAHPPLCLLSGRSKHRFSRVTALPMPVPAVAVIAWWWCQDVSSRSTSKGFGQKLSLGLGWPATMISLLKASLKNLALLPLLSRSGQCGSPRLKTWVKALLSSILGWRWWRSGVTHLLGDIRLAKRAHKPLKKTTGKAAAEGCRVVRLMAEARETALYLLESVSRLLPEQVGSCPNASKWSLVSKRFQKRKVVCEERQLRALERSMGDLGDGVGILFRRLIQSRVALLNILSS